MNKNKTDKIKRKKVTQDSNIFWEIFNVETRTEGEIIELLQKHGIQNNSRCWKDYEKSKDILFGDLPIEPEIRDEQIKWIYDYVGV